MSTEPTIDWYRSPVEPELLQELNRRDNVKGLLQTGSHLALITLTFLSALYAQANLSWPWLIAAILVHGNVTKFSINAVHEFVHGTVFRTKWLNTFFGYVYGFLGWIHPHHFWSSHTEHHKFTVHPPYDLEVVAPGRLNFKHFLLNCIFDPYALVGPIRGNWGYAMGRFADDGWEAHLLKGNPARKRQIVVWAWTLLIGHAIIAAVSLYYGYWLIPVLISLNPSYGGLLLYLCNTLQHTGLPGEVSDYRLSCRTIRLNPFLEFLYWHMNYHTEHHMYAAVPCYNLKQLHRAIRDDLPPTHHGLRSAWYEQIAIQHRLDEDPDYRFMQQLPSSGVETLPETESLPAVSGSTADARLDTDSTETESSTDADADLATRVWECTVCGFIYDESLGLPDEGIEPGTSWEDIPDDWMCPDCGVGKEDFDMVEI